MPCSLKFDKETVVMDVQSVYRLVLLQGPTPGKVYELRTETASIGRDISNEVIIADTEVSRFHARLVWQNGDQPGQLQGYAIEDRGSTNGTFVNGLRLVGRRPLMPNEIINFGEKVSLRFEVLPASSSNAATEIAGGFLNPSATLVPNEPAAPISAYAPQQPYIPPVAPAMPEPLPKPAPPAAPQPVAPAIPAQYQPPVAPQPVRPPTPPQSAYAPAPVQPTYAEAVQPVYPPPPADPQMFPGHEQSARPANIASEVGSKPKNNLIRNVLLGCGCLSALICIALLAGLFWIETQNAWCTYLSWLPILSCP
jgi:hypothetical protein